MRTEVYGTDGENLVFVLGWGNKPEHENVRWLIDNLVETGYRVHAIKIPLTATNFEEQYLEPVREYVDSLSSYRLLTHSLGGLIGTYLDDPVTRVNLSPWWGISMESVGILGNILLRLPISRPIIPIENEAEDLGMLVSDQTMADIPSRIAPTLFREVKNAQNNMPPFDEESVVFYAPEDTIVSPEAIRKRASDENLVSYDGGHELFSSSVRDEHLPLLYEAIESGVDAFQRVETVNRQ